MKFKVTFKDPDGVYESLDEAAKEWAEEAGELDKDELESITEMRRAKLKELTNQWFAYGEYVGLEIDTDTKTIKVLPAST